MADPGVNTDSTKMQTSSPENGVISINDEADVIMISLDEDTPPAEEHAPAALTEIAISDDETDAKTTNLEEIVISDDDNDDNACEDASDEGEVTEITELPDLQKPPQENNVGQDNDQDKSIEITFSSTELLAEYQQQFRAFLQRFKQFKYLEQGNKLLLTNDVDLQGWVVVNSVDDVNNEDYEIDQNGKKRKRREHDATSSRHMDNLFILDTEPCNEVESSPIYRSKYKVIEDAMPGEENDEKVKNKREEYKLACFNCDGEHTLRDCPLPKDNRRIKNARQKLNFKQLTRYHEEGNNKYNNLKAGVLSETLRKALGVRKHDIPPHVYKMRVMGYPPGWLEEAKVFHSNLALFDSDGKKDARSKAISSYTIAPEKIVDYPGFNCKPERGFRDDYHFFGVPPYSTALSKDNMIDFVNKMLQQEAEQHTQVERRSKSPSPSLTDLELQKRQLLEQLTSDNDNDNENDDSNTSNTPISPTPTETTTPAAETLIATNNDEVKQEEGEEQPQKKEQLDLNKAENLTTSRKAPDLEETTLTLDLNKTIENTKDDDIPTPMTPSTPVQQSSAINSSLPGTPIIKSMSPFARLPSLDNFQKDVSPVINFENLPNATGKYEQMTAVLEKVRSTLKSRFQT